MQESILKSKRPRIGHIWIRFRPVCVRASRTGRPKIGHIKPRDLAGAIKEETPIGSKSQAKS